MATKNALGFKKSEYVKPVSGIATIKAGKEKARVTFQDEEIKFSTGKNTMTVSLDDLPERPTISPDSEEDYFVKFSPEDDTIFYIGPIEGVYSAKLIDFSRSEKDADPAPYDPYAGKEKKNDWPPFLAFNSFFQIQSGPFKKIRIPYWLHYKFAENPQKAGETVFDGDPDNKKAKWLPKLIEMCEKCGLVSEPIEWPEDTNILPELLQRALDNDKTVKIVVKNGYIDSLMSSNKNEDDEEEDDTESKPKSKPVKRVNKKDEDSDEDL